MRGAERGGEERSASRARVAALLRADARAALAELRRCAASLGRGALAADAARGRGDRRDVRQGQKAGKKAQAPRVQGSPPAAERRKAAALRPPVARSPAA